MNKVEAHVVAPGVPSSPATAAIMARVDELAVAYRDLAAIPRDKAILQVERPDLMTYQPHLSFSPLDPPRRQRSLSPPATSPAMSPEAKGRRAESDGGSPGGSTLQLHAGRKVGTGLQHFHRPDNESNIYTKPPIYKQAEGSRLGGGGGVIQAAKFPAAQPPDPTQPSKIETDFWPCPPSLAAMEIEWRKKKMEQAEDNVEELSDESQELEKIKSNLGRLILRREKAETGVNLGLVRKKAEPAHPPHASESPGTSRSPSHPASGLSRRQSAEFSAAAAADEAERRATAPSSSGPRHIAAQHLGAQGVSLRNAGGDPQGALQAPSRSGPNPTGETSGPSGVPPSFRNERLGI
ncbi:dematin isoform 1-T3 [Syngnathus typhle]